MSGRNIALTGVPRSGTTLCCKLLGQAADTVALFEPMPVHELPLRREQAIAAVDAFFSASRRGLLESGKASSQQVGGQVPDNPFGSERGHSGPRVRMAHLGEIVVEKPLSAGFTLVVKHNAAFTALLPELGDAFDCYAVVRNPLAVLASWNSVDLPVAAGRMPAGERLDPALAARLDGEPEVLQRQLCLLDWVFGRFAAYVPTGRIIRYEEVVASEAGALAATTGVAVPRSELSNRNASALYDPEACRRYADGLSGQAGAWGHFYDASDIGNALDVLLGER
ncbi:hypothetical protein [Stenotrophomonas sp. PS02297]|uniref:hypothetical protein n=1 Tax=Stenotrophomonas sp. PS02297 TaxID=2991423 RepID=UPI00249C1454|nr:hypothetical protein [Stenotrophomonas sp. PS02297]